MITLPSYEHDARIWPNFGCAQATCHTGPVCLPGSVDEFTLFGTQEKRKASELPFQCLAGAALRLVIDYIEDFDGTIRGACCEALPVVVQLRVVLGKVSVSVMTCGRARWRVRSCLHGPFQWALRLRVPRSNDVWLLTFSDGDDDGPWRDACSSSKVKSARHSSHRDICDSNT
jgi:hypothetical protein